MPGSRLSFHLPSGIWSARGSCEGVAPDGRVLGSWKTPFEWLTLTYAGNIADATCFAQVLPCLKQRMLGLQRDLDSMTVVYDRGNVSRANQHQVDESGLHYVSGLTVASQRELVDEANALLEPVQIGEDEEVPAYRTKGSSENICNDLDADPSRLASLLVVAIRRVFLLLAPCQPGASSPNS